MRISDSKNDPRGLWKNLRTRLPVKKQNTISSLETESGTVNNDTEIANAINNFFATIDQKLASKFDGFENTTTTTFDVQSHDNTSFSFSNVTVSQVLKQLKKLDVNKATGLDNISARLLKSDAVPLSTPLTHIFNVSLRTGLFHQNGKLAGSHHCSRMVRGQQ